MKMATRQTRFGVFRQLFLLTGDPILSHVSSRLYTLYSCSAILCVVVTSLTMTLDPLVNLNDIRRCTESARVVLPMFICLWIHVTRLKKQQLLRLLDLTEAFSWEDLPMRGMAAYIPMIRKYSWPGVLGIMCSHALHQVVRLSGHERPLVYNAWFPFDATRSPVFELVYLVQTVATIWYTITLTAFIALYATLVAIACTQVQKLAAAALEQEFELDKWVRAHQRVKEFLRTLQDVYNLVLLGPFLLISVGMCVNTFSILVGDAMDALQAATLIVALVCQLYVYCWFGNELTEETAQLRDAVWSSNWVGTDVQKQKCLVLVLAAAEEFTLVAGGVYPVSRHTLMQILNQTYSFFMFLLNFMD
ncbi:hypothetical protein L9F63_015890, partial [Diploptera punctata]